MTYTLRLTYTALGGLFGALLMLAGDLLLYAHWSEAPEAADAVLSFVPLRQTILLAEPIHLHLSAVLGPVASIALLLGAYHIYLRLERGSKAWAAVAGLAFGFAVVIGGTYHALWSLYGFVLQFANSQDEVPYELIENVSGTMDYVSAVLSPPTFLAFAILFGRILLGRSDFPKWMALLTPLPLILLGGVFLNDLASALASPFDALAKGTFFNAVMTVFFVASLVAPSRSREAQSSPSET